VGSTGDLTELLAEQVRAASADRAPLRIVGGDTKRFYGRPVTGSVLSIAGHSGIVRYDPAELVITARAGTLLREIDDALAEKGQHLPFEPPAFGDPATIGGTVAAGIAGPARHANGPVRDFILGTRILSGDGRVLRFGGEVMKNVAGYDLSRLMAGSLGILGVLLDVSIKVLPRAPARLTRALTIDQADALRRMQQLARSGLPVSASAWLDGRWYVRLDASPQALDAASAQLGGDVVPDAADFWSGLREQTHPFFTHAPQLWRVTVPAHCLPLAVDSPTCIEWNGVQRWYADVDGESVKAATATCGGHVTCFRGAPATAEVFAPLPQPLMRLHKSLKTVFDPAGVLNPGRMYSDL
jgi:glycolate oxidase FAD binding subunit